MQPLDAFLASADTNRDGACVRVHVCESECVCHYVAVLASAPPRVQTHALYSMCVCVCVCVCAFGCVYMGFAGHVTVEELRAAVRSVDKMLTAAAADEIVRGLCPDGGQSVDLRSLRRSLQVLAPPSLPLVLV